ncbi:MAG: oligoendopeptidase F [Chloroflexi bacterium]|nr:oligoendopeptidase F [Chloroflexota bacterium]
MTVTLPARAEVPIEHTWDLASIYPDQAAWAADVEALEAELAAIVAFRGRLGESAATLLAWLQLVDRLQVAMGRLYTYAQMCFDVDTTNQVAAGLRERAIGLSARLGAATAFAEPELLALSADRLASLVAAEPALAPYQHYFANLRRRGPYVRSGEVEQLLAQAGEPLSTPVSAFMMLADSDLRFAAAEDSSGVRHEVARGTIEELLQSPDRTLRKQAWQNYQDGFLAFQHTFGAIYAGSVKADVFLARARGYDSALAASLHASNLPRTVYDNVIAACNRHLPIWHRYWELRRRALGLAVLEPYDIFAPLGPPYPVPYERAVELICASVEPLGDEYVAVARAGLTSQRWVDIYPNRGKTSGAYSGGSYDTHPFILMNYDGSLSGASTLAHELGHSMHSWLTNHTQPPVYASYALFVAEVASNLNQALLRGYLLARRPERALAIAVLEEAMHNFHRYLFLMPILSQFEQRVHEQAEAGEPLTGAGMGALLAELFRRGYGPAVQVDEARVGITWAAFPHLYQNFYVFQYASGIAAANALAERVLAGAPGAAERYLACLRAGGSRYPLEALELVGIDMRTPEPLDRAFAVLERFVDRLEQLLFVA